MKKKTLLITHTDLDGISPIILLNLTGIKFEYKTVEIADLETVWNELVEAGFEKYDQIYFTDLSLTQNMYDYINEHELNVKVFDHHETHLFANVYPYVTVKVDIDGVPTCATELFYLYLKKIYKDELNKKSLKQYVDYVRELDTYKFTSDIPRQIDSLKSTYGSKDFIKSFTRRLKNKEEFSFTSFEKRLTKVKAEELQRYLEKKEKKMVRYKIDGHDVGVVFAETNKSDLGNYLSKNNPDLEFIILIDASSRISYRASRDDVNVSEFASIYGGGGHKLASGSGFTDEDRDKIVSMYFKDVKKIEI
jgi:oligoribonuclease NrnB/cAMP/cGMP phosphodiesterase (DHH superfamily)